ncbi:hypothetical protein ACJX0J_010348, partial [Zea mays]
FKTTAYYKYSLPESLAGDSTVAKTILSNLRYISKNDGTCTKHNKIIKTNTIDTIR